MDELEIKIVVKIFRGKGPRKQFGHFWFLKESFEVVPVGTTQGWVYPMLKIWQVILKPMVRNNDSCFAHRERGHLMSFTLIWYHFRIKNSRLTSLFVRSFVFEIYSIVQIIVVTLQCS
jgi:hypothetical protein